jgi:hypothetical protein
MKRFRRPRYWLLALTLLVAFGAVWVTTRTISRPRVTRANFEKIKKGMSHEDVTAILGESCLLAGDSFGVDVYYQDPDPRPPWEWETVSIDIYFKKDKVEEARFQVTERTWAECLKGWRSWVGL